MLRRHMTNYDVEYEQANEALETIVRQANTLVFMGNQAELSSFIQKFVAMASKTASAAKADGRPDVADRFFELIRKAEALRETVASPKA